MLHLFKTDIANESLPREFTFPFHYVPHPLCVMAASEVQEYLAGKAEWAAELARGKMFGVLVVQTADGKIGYLAAYSGILAGRNNHEFFVPPVYDLLQPDGFFKREEEEISAINHRLAKMEQDAEYAKAKELLDKVRKETAEKLTVFREDIRKAKVVRDSIRSKGTLSNEENAALIRESQFMKAELKRMERNSAERLAELEQRLKTFTEPQHLLKKERKVRSAALQQKLFEQFRMLNARGEVKDLCQIFVETPQRVPPAGAGECAAPKMLQYAYRMGLKPICMAEFWWGASPKAEIRKHGYYYPACKSKCEPILGHMLQGLTVEENPLIAKMKAAEGQELQIAYEDEWLMVVEKPEGILSVPGKEATTSVYDMIRKCRPEASGPLMVHRLDMATSGLLLIAKSKDVHQQLQTQFENRTVEKRYTAILDGVVRQVQGSIDLPLCLDPTDRPRQIVSHEMGKPALTLFEVLEIKNGHTRVAFHPHMGRTHQLRVHAAHHQGLGCPILGDELYGRKAERLHLHAEYLAFTHPVTGKRIELTSPAPF